jgi:MFS family permease
MSRKLVRFMPPPRSVPFAVVLLIVANTTPRLVRRLGTRAVVTIGLALVGISMLMRVPFSVHTGYAGILESQVLFAIGMGLTIAPATSSIMGAVPAERAGVGSAINDTTRQVGGALGVAVMGSVGASLYHHDIAQRLGDTRLPTAVAANVRSSVGAGLQAAHALPQPLRTTVNAAVRHAFIRGSDVASLVAVVVAAVGVVVAYRFLPRGMRVGSTAPSRPGPVTPALSLATEVDA